jgi:hypothetical protein
MLGEHGRSTALEVNVSSTKGAIGHLLGAAGAVEALFTVLAMHQVRHVFSFSYLLLQSSTVEMEEMFVGIVNNNIKCVNRT